ncbi:DUF1365 domain-containing protein [Luteolibacter sp. AS25]|uniref:DUF1365 domain-containing protein n=1 Tax=Luteolibacter sp. AS25 TaxID=3135776 RepID=UPI00398B2DA2
MTPSVYEATITHTRVSPGKHAFSYRVFMFAIDLDHFPKLPLLSRNRLNIFSIDDRDHIRTDPEKNTRQNLTDFLAQNGSPIPPDAKVTLLTFPRVLGYSFNPVSFYYISSPAGLPITAVAEVTNTFREMKLYPLGTPDAQEKFDHTTPKEFYVSPFSDPNDTFHFRLHQPTDTWTVHIDNLTTGKPTLLSHIRSTRKSLTTPRLAWFALKYPLLSLAIIFRIHLHALLLFLKKIPHFPKSTPIQNLPTDH